jgi:hypothetical protein
MHREQVQGDVAGTSGAYRREVFDALQGKQHACSDDHVRVACAFGMVERRPALRTVRD